MAEEENSNFFEIDSNLSKNKKYRDDYETFLKKIKSNFIDEKEFTTNDLTTIEQMKYYQVLLMRCTNPIFYCFQQYMKEAL